MKVFVSWSGERSQIFAQALHDWLPMVLQSAAPWLSHADIAAGERWADTVAKELEVSNFGITCITRENVSSPWILFEVGALAKRMQEGRVIPLLLDLEFRDIAGPLAQFQAKKAERDGLFDVVSSINQLSEVKVSDQLLTKQFDALWPMLEKKIGEVPKHATPAKQHRPQQEILEELVSGIRGLDVRFRDALDEPPMRRRRGKMHHHMMREFFHVSEMMTDGPRDPLRLLIMFSLVKDELPWLYELAVDAYHETVRRSARATAAQLRLRKALEFMRRGPWLMEVFENKEMHMVFRELDHFVHEFDIEEPEPPAQIKSSKSKKADST
jgi:hypothetical protein